MFGVTSHSIGGVPFVTAGARAIVGIAGSSKRPDALVQQHVVAPVVAHNQILRSIVSLVLVDVVDLGAAGKSLTERCRCDQDVLINVACLIRVWVFRLVDAYIPVRRATGCGLASVAAAES